VVYDSHLTIVLGDRDRIPTRLSDCAAISGIASPIYAVTLLKAFRFGDCHCCELSLLAYTDAIPMQFLLGGTFRWTQI